MIKLAEAKTISSTAAKTVLEEIIDCADADVAAIVKEKGLAQISDTSALEGVVEQVLADNAKAVEDYHNGKTNVLGFLVGQCMRLSKGKGNPAVLRELLEKKI